MEMKKQTAQETKPPFHLHFRLKDYQYRYWSGLEGFLKPL